MEAEKNNSKKETREHQASVPLLRQKNSVMFHLQSWESDVFNCRNSGVFDVWGLFLLFFSLFRTWLTKSTLLQYRREETEWGSNEGNFSEIKHKGLVGTVITTNFILRHKTLINYCDWAYYLHEGERIKSAEGLARRRTPPLKHDLIGEKGQRNKTKIFC